jgi:hypothetical protein
MVKIKFLGQMSGFVGSLVVQELGYDMWDPNQTKEVTEETKAFLVSKYPGLFADESGSRLPLQPKAKPVAEAVEEPKPRVAGAPVVEAKATKETPKGA